MLCCAGWCRACPWTAPAAKMATAATAKTEQRPCVNPLHAPLVCSFHAGKPPGPLHPKTSCVHRESKTAAVVAVAAADRLRLLCVAAVDIADVLLRMKKGGTEVTLNTGSFNCPSRSIAALQQSGATLRCISFCISLCRQPATASQTDLARL